MPKNKKKIHDLLSPRIAAKRKRRAQVAKEEMLRIASGGEPNIPVTVNNYLVNKPLFSPHRIRKLEVPIVQKKISQTEGKATVNTKTGKAIEKLIHKPEQGIKMVDPALGVIEVRPKDKKAKKRKKSSR